MLAFYCDVCDSVVVIKRSEGLAQDTYHSHQDGTKHLMTPMGYWHPDWKEDEIVTEILHQIETVGLAPSGREVDFSAWNREDENVPDKFSPDDLKDVVGGGVLIYLDKEIERCKANLELAKEADLRVFYRDTLQLYKEFRAAVTAMLQKWHELT